ncbi:MAG TPA: DUF4012 domain-containing protein [Acidimicrobiales bacterium]
MLAGVLTVVASTCNRATIIVTASVATALSRGWLIIPAGLALGSSVAYSFLRRSYRRISAVIGAVAIQVLLRLPSVGFHGLTALVAGAAFAFVAASSYRHLTLRWRRIMSRSAIGLATAAVIVTLPLLAGALLARHAASRGVSLAQQALTAVEGGDAASATTQLDSAMSALRAAHSRTGEWWTAGALLVPGAAQQRRAIAGATGAASALTSVASREARGLDYHGLSYDHGQVNMAALAAMGGPIAALNSQLLRAQADLAHSGSEWLVSPVATRFRHFSTEVQKVERNASLGQLAVQDAPGLLGAAGPRQYFVAFMTPSETRGLDGFVGIYALMTADQGRLTLGHASTILTLDNALGSHPPLVTGVPEYLARYGAFHPESHFQDVTYSPDFPTVERVIAQMYQNTTGRPIDGVFALDGDAVAALLHFTGPLNVKGLPFPLTADNAGDVLLRQQYTLFPNKVQPSRDAFLADAVDAAFSRLNAGSLPGPKELGAVLGPEVRQGRLLLWTGHPADWPLLQRAGLAGGFPKRGRSSDLLAVTMANAGNNKIDAYLREHVDDQVTYNPASGHVSGSVTIQFENTAPSSGLPDYVIGINSGAPYPRGTNDMWLSVYSPFILTDSSVNGTPVGFSPGIKEDGVTAYSAFLAIPAGGTSTLRLNFDGSLRRGSSYGMTLRMQPLAVAPTADVRVSTSSGSSGTAWSTDESAGEVQSRSWRFSS